MSFSKPLCFLASLLLLLCIVSASDVIVQLHVNRPFTDVSEKFVSVAIKPEDLFSAIDGPNRRTATWMATMLGDSNVKFLGDFNFAESAGRIFQNSAKVIWKSFNHWTRAVNWTMVIPVPYTPDAWDTMQTLQILNTSYSVGINDCVWQLGTDFSSSRAEDYVNELSTFKLMVDSFRPVVHNWKIMGADIMAGSSMEETRRYVELSKDLNAAFGWTQAPELIPLNRLSAYIYDSDAALKVLLSKNVPVWLTLPEQKRKMAASTHFNRLDGEAVNHAFRSAITLGEAASQGFDAVFQRMEASDLAHPSFSFYVTATFKRVMGARVFPSRPLPTFASTSKLYTHCAKDVSGGIAFMMVNSNERVMQITVRSMVKSMGTEFWQYSFQQKQGVMLLNGKRLALNTKLLPQIMQQRSDKAIKLMAPGMSVNFWVFPQVGLEHCQFSSAAFNELTNTVAREKAMGKRYTSADRLLRQLIRETSLWSRALARNNDLGERLSTIDSRGRRLTNPKFAASIRKLLQSEPRVSPNGTEVIPRSMRAPNLTWMKQILLPAEPRLNLRVRRNADYGYLKPFLLKETASKFKEITGKISENEKPLALAHQQQPESKTGLEMSSGLEHALHSIALSTPTLAKKSKNTADASTTGLFGEFSRAQRQLSESPLNEQVGQHVEDVQDSLHLPKLLAEKYLDYYDAYFDGMELKLQSSELHDVQLHTPQKRRSTRALKYPKLFEDSWHNNAIVEDIEFNSLDKATDRNAAFHQYKVQSDTQKMADDEAIFSDSEDGLVSKLTKSISHFMQTFRDRFSYWCNTLDDYMKASTKTT